MSKFYNDELAEVLLCEGDFEEFSNEISKPNRPKCMINDRLIATQFQFKSEALAHEIMPVRFDRTFSPFYSGERWAVRQGAFCLTKTGEWEHEPIPSSRSRKFYSRCRFESLEEALQTYDIQYEARLSPKDCTGLGLSP